MRARLRGHGLAPAARFRSGRRGVHTGVVVHEALWVLAVLAVLPVFVSALGVASPLTPLLSLSLVVAAAVPAVLLAPSGRSHFRGDARP